MSDAATMVWYGVEPAASAPRARPGRPSVEGRHERCQDLLIGLVLRDEVRVGVQQPFEGRHVRRLVLRAHDSRLRHLEKRVRGVAGQLPTRSATSASVMPGRQGELELGPLAGPDEDVHGVADAEGLAHVVVPRVEGPAPLTPT